MLYELYAHQVDLCGVHRIQSIELRLFVDCKLQFATIVATTVVEQQQKKVCSKVALYLDIWNNGLLNGISGWF